jgi:hypothetical protein
MEIRVDSVGNGHFKLPQNALENSNAIFELALFDLNNKKPSGYLKGSKKIKSKTFIKGFFNSILCVLFSSTAID